MAFAEEHEEPMCPVKGCGYPMKEFVTMFRCRNLSCRHEIKKRFPPGPVTMHLEDEDVNTLDKFEKEES